jgi:hypothetical protein
MGYGSWRPELDSQQWEEICLFPAVRGPPSMGYRELFPKRKTVGGEADYLPPTGAKDKNDGAVGPLCHTPSWRVA